MRRLRNAGIQQVSIPVVFLRCHLLAVGRWLLTSLHLLLVVLRLLRVVTVGFILLAVSPAVVCPLLLRCRIAGLLCYLRVTLRRRCVPHRALGSGRIGCSTILLSRTRADWQEVHVSRIIRRSDAVDNRRGLRHLITVTARH